MPLKDSKRFLALIGLAVALLAGFFAWWLPAAAPLASGLLAAMLIYVGLRMGNAWFFAGAAMYMAASALGGSMLYGASWILGLAPAAAVCIPSMVTLLLMRRKMPFFELLKIIALGCLGLLVVGYAVVMFTLGDPVNLLVEAFKTAFSTQPVDLQDSFLYVLASQGALPWVEPITFGNIIAYPDAERVKLLAQLWETFDLSMRMSLPRILVSWTAVTAFAACFLPLVRLAQIDQLRTMGVTVPPEPASIHLPRKANTAMLLACIGLWLIYLFSGSAAMQAIYNAAWELLMVIYIIQGLSVSVWFLRKKRVARGLRIALCFAGCMPVINYVPFLIGFVDQLFMFRLPRVRIMNGSGSMPDLGIYKPKKDYTDHEPPKREEPERGSEGEKTDPTSDKPDDHDNSTPGGDAR